MIVQAKEASESPDTEPVQLSPTGSVKQICIYHLILSITGSQKVHIFNSEAENTNWILLA